MLASFLEIWIYFDKYKITDQPININEWIPLIPKDKLKSFLGVRFSEFRGKVK